MIGSAWSAAYDAAGNLTCRASIPSVQTCLSGGGASANALSYDNAGRLATWQSTPTAPTSSAAYLYDGAGQRVEQVATSSGTTTTTSYIGSLEEVTTSGGVTTTTAYYGAIAESVNRTLAYLLADGLGSVSEAVSTTSGSVTASQLYGPSGTVRYQSGTLPTSKGFTGQRADSATNGLDDYGARYYDPLAEQFTSADTTLAGGLNRYAYVAGNPETFVDPGGHYGQSCEIGLCGGPDNGIPLDQGGNPGGGSFGGGGGEPPPEGNETDPSLTNAPITNPNDPAFGMEPPKYLGSSTETSETELNAEETQHLNQVNEINQEERDQHAGSSTQPGGGVQTTSGDTNVPAGQKNAANEPPTGPNIVYRGLASNDNPSSGIQARDPEAQQVTPISHVAGKRSSPWISTTRSLSVAQSKYDRNGVIAIDLTQVNAQIVDFSQGIPGREGQMISNWAAKDQEVLIWQYIPPQSIIWIPTP